MDINSNLDLYRAMSEHYGNVRGVSVLQETDGSVVLVRRGYNIGVSVSAKCVSSHTGVGSMVRLSVMPGKYLSVIVYDSAGHIVVSYSVYGREFRTAVRFDEYTYAEEFAIVSECGEVAIVL